MCRECGGGEICEHGKVRDICKECGGSQICEHGKRKSDCKECGNRFCEHGKRKDRCKECDGNGDGKRCAVSMCLLFTTLPQSLLHNGLGVQFLRLLHKRVLFR